LANAPSRPPTSGAADLPVQAFLRQIGASDLRKWLGLPADASPQDALLALERKRVKLERGLSDPRTAREAELLLEHYNDLRDALSPRARAHTTLAPDYYAALGVPPTASFSEVERAWHRAVSAGRDGDPIISQAWRVLGDPLNRAAFDRSRRDQISAAHPPTEYNAADFKTDSVPMEPGCRAEVPGPELRDVAIGTEGVVTLAIPLIIRGSGRWHASIHVDHDCLSTAPAHRLDLAPGHHTLAVRIDPERVGRRGVACSITLRATNELHVVALRVRRVNPGRSANLELGAAVVAAAVLLAAGWWIGSQTTVQPVQRGPSSEGVISQIPTVAACLDEASALPSWVDVHTDGLGRPTGFSFGGAASSNLDGCVRDALLNLEFPPTRDGLPAFHRYHVQP
jgi:hypothetical protein